MGKAALISLLIFFGSTACPQDFPQLRFSLLTDKDGLSINKTNAVTQDKDGIIWVSTSNGLNRFDGYGFTRYFSDPADPQSISANDIPAIGSDNDNNLWLFTSAGLCRFSTHTHKAVHFNSGPGTPPTFRTFDNSTIFFGDKGEVNVVSPSGLYQFADGDRYKYVDEGVKPFIFQQRPYSFYQEIVRDKNGGLWASQQNIIYRLDPVSKKVSRTFVSDKDLNIFSISFDSYGHCWVSTWRDGILRFDTAGNRWTRMNLEHTVGAVMKKSVEWKVNGRAYMIFPSNLPGLLLLDEQTGQTKFYNIGFSSSNIGPPFIDRQNILWIPSDQGLYYFSPNNLFDLIELHSRGDGKTDPYDLTTAYDMREDPSGYWVARRYNGGVVWFTRDWKLVHCWRRPVENSSGGFLDEIGNTREAFDFRQAGNQMYMTTEWGMLVLDLHSLKRRLYRDPAIPRIMRLRTIAVESEHKWWIRSFDQGVFLFDPVERRFIRHYLLADECSGCGPPSNNFLLRDQKGRVFCTTNAGLYKYDDQTDSFYKVRFAGNPAIGSSLIGLAEDSAGQIWLGLDNGICAYNPGSGKVEKWFSENNTIGPVHRICTDTAQNIWFNSIDGYWCWLRRQDKIIHFTFSQGLPDNDEGLFYRTSDGNIYAGCYGGLVRFHADRLMNYSFTATVRIMDALVNDTTAKFTIGSQGEKRLLLRPDENNLQVNFDVVNYDQPENNLFFYKLTPGPDNWNQLENGRLSFNNLPPGDYELKVRGANKLTAATTGTDTLAFTITPNWYQNWWFKSLVALAIALLIIFIAQRRIRYIRKESAFRQKIADTEMQALRAQMNPHFLFNSLNSIENFIMKNEKRLASDYLNKFARLIRMILDSSRNELVPFSKDIEALQLYVDLEQLRFSNKFSYMVSIDPVLTGGDFRVPSLLIQPYVENAIVHGIAQSGRRGHTLLVAAFLDNDYIHYVIQDDGIGRRKAAEYNRQNKPHHRSIGLKITEDRINIINQRQNSAGAVQVIDLYDEDGQAAGTKIEITIKAV